MPLFSRARGPDPASAAAVAAQLARLDPWSFWTVPADDRFVVAGTTGVFLIVPEEREGYLEVDGRKVRVGDAALDLRKPRVAADQLRATLASGSVFAEPSAVLCLTRGVVGAPRTVGEVRIVSLDQLVADLVRRARVLPPTRAQRAARLLGMTIAGDQRRHHFVRREASG